MAPLPTIALLTDFGYSDAYVGVMKAVLLTRCPHARLLDLTHGIAPQDVRAGALLLASAVPYCPAGTVFLAVVDPGVGGERRAICLRGGGHLFVGPDNGLLWPAASTEATLAAEGVPAAFHLDRPEHWLTATPGATFHGRDVFAPIAAALTAGRAPEDLGTPLDDPVRLDPPRPTRNAGEVRGEVLLIDHFGNAVTNLRPVDLDHPAPGAAAFEVAGRVLAGPDTHYAARREGEIVIVAGSLGYYEIAVRGGSAARALDLKPGSPVTARRRQERSAGR